MKILISSFLLYVLILISKSVHAIEKFTIELEMKDGNLIPQILKVPSKMIIRIKISNTGTQPSEFESTQLHKEKVLAPGANSVLVIAPLKPGSYIFFDDFHLSSPIGKIIAIE